MKISWNWLKQYVRLDVPVEELTRRLMLAGLNHESTEEVAGDFLIDLEVTSNRPDCLGHLGIAREVAVLFDRELTMPAAAPKQGAKPVGQLTSVRVDCPEWCPRYTARVIEGIKIGPSPDWLRHRLATVGQPSINNVVDITNYVMLESGQPLHAFDFDQLHGQKIVVRAGREGESLVAIDHKTYPVGPAICVIADADRPVAIAGVMGGADTEVTSATRRVLLEAAIFDPLNVRNTARKLALHSDSSYRFERGLDPAGVDWASRRACELILELCGGELAAGVADAGQPPAERAPIVLRLTQIPRVLGIEMPAEDAQRILTALGCREVRVTPARLEVVPPSWRRDLEREIDLIEEVARIYGYDAIPENVRVPMAASARSDQDRLLAKVRQVLVGAGYDEALTLSLVEEELAGAFSPWTDAPPLVSRMPVLRRADRLRRSLVPSLLQARRTNEALSNPAIELFEVARAYLPEAGGLPHEELMLAVTSGGDFLTVKGLVEALLDGLRSTEPLSVAPTSQALFAPGRACELRFGKAVLGYLGEVSPAGLKQFDLRLPTTVLELRIAELARVANPVPQYERLPTQPSTTRDMNFVVEERVRWADLASLVRKAAGEPLEELQYRDTYRDPERLGAGKKSLLLSLTLRAAEGTLTSEQADAVRDRVRDAAQQQLGAELR